MKLQGKKPKLKHVLTTCCWCNQKIGENQEIFSLGCKKRSNIDISKYEGGIIPITIATVGKTKWAIVPAADSDAQREGKDFLFVLCSEKCGYYLKQALQQDKEIGDILYPI